MKYKRNMLRNLLAYYGMIIMIYFIYFDIDGHGDEYGIFPKIFMVLLPFFTSNHFWNWKLYNYLNKEAYTNEKEYKATYLNFINFFIVIMFLFDIGMTYGIFIIIRGPH